MLDVRRILEDALLVIGVVLKQIALWTIYFIEKLYEGFVFLYSNPTYRLLVVASAVLITLLIAF